MIRLLSCFIYIEAKNLFATRLR